jgi:hypothetical protein
MANAAPAEKPGDKPKDNKAQNDKPVLDKPDGTAENAAEGPEDVNISGA